MNKQHLVPVERIEHAIVLIRGQKVMLDRDLATLYGVETKNLNKAVRRNFDRFPSDFMFQLTAEEAQNLRFQIGTSSSGYGGRRYLPYVFTEQGVAMLSSVLRSKQAVQVNVAIMRAFVRLREALALHKELARKLNQLEKKIEVTIRLFSPCSKPSANSWLRPFRSPSPKSAFILRKMPFRTGRNVNPRDDAFIPHPSPLILKQALTHALCPPDRRHDTGPTSSAPPTSISPPIHPASPCRAKVERRRGHPS